MIYLTEQQIVAINTMLIRRYSPKEPIVCGKINVHTIAAQKYTTPQAA